MEKLGVKKSGVLAVLLIALFVTSVFSVFSITTNAVKPVIVKIGVISPMDDFIPGLTALYGTIVGPDINAYVAKLPADRFNPPVKFEFDIVSTDGSADAHLAQLVKFHKEGVNLIIGGMFSSQIDQRNLDYLKNNNMVMISPFSNSPDLAKVDNLFRMLPDASSEGVIVAAMFAKLGLNNAIVLERNDGFGSGVYNAFKSAFTGTGTVYTYTFTPLDTTDFANKLATANTQAKSLTSVGVFLIAIDNDCADQLNRDDFATAYPYLGGLPWFGTDGTSFSSILTGTNVGKLKLLTPSPATPHNTKFDEMNTRYTNAMGYPMDFSGACLIDAGWMLAQAVIETRPTSIWYTPGANDVKKVLLDDSSRYFGYSGWCQLNRYGDRVSGNNWDIWGYGLSTDVPPVLITPQYGSYSYSGIGSKTDPSTISWIITPTWP